jgi:hypothetical protein
MRHRARTTLPRRSLPTSTSTMPGLLSRPRPGAVNSGIRVIVRSNRQRVHGVEMRCRRGDLNPHGTRYRQILSLLRMPISPLRRGRVLNLTSYRSMRQPHLALRGACTDTQQTLRIKSLLRMPNLDASNCRSNPCDACGLPAWRLQRSDAWLVSVGNVLGID